MRRGLSIASVTAAFLFFLTGSASAISYNPSGLTFAKQKLGSVSPPQAVTVSGGGCGPDYFDGMNIVPGPCYTEPTDIAVSGPFGIIADSCPNPLYSIDINNHPPCSISVVFYPTAKGEQKGFLRLTSSPAIAGVPLSGVGCEKSTQEAPQEAPRQEARRQEAAGLQITSPVEKVMASGGPTG